MVKSPASTSLTAISFKKRAGRAEVFLNPSLLGLDDPGLGELDSHNASAVAIPHEPSQATNRHSSRFAAGKSRRLDQGYRVDPSDPPAIDGKLFGRVVAVSFFHHVV
jgi:hypothetical protein